ncbi:LamG domain-containing protein [Cryptosporangium phraense]|uniref:LamG domain-containing protein n=1 Tax=Cryptosporangium phraense TaxID=2593070 RepID=A0A545AM32_9ACTN|nr:LamG domain-containing protein [Cryptosporangium phraense]TQS42366.1 LamG domain-containing protein [Cryptosporangium phraense]
MLVAWAALVGVAATPTAGGWNTTDNTGNAFKSTATFLTYPGEVLRDSPSAYYRLSEAAGGTTLTDSSGNGRTGTYSVNTATATNFGRPGAPVGGSSNTAVAFTATNTNQVAMPAAASPTSVFTMEVWFNTTAASGVLMSLGNNVKNDSSYLLRLLAIQSSAPAGRLVFGLSTGAVGSTVKKTVVSATAVNDGNWHHAVATYSSGTMILYVDGVAQTPTTGVGTLTAISPSYWRVGGDASGTTWPGTYGDYLTGTLDEAAVYQSALSATRVTAHYTAGTSYPSAVLADVPRFYWRLNDAEGQTAADAGPNGLPGEYRIDPQARAGATGALTGPVTGSDAAVRFAGYYGHASGPLLTSVSGATTVETWFKTTTQFGGVLVGLAAQTNCSNRKDRDLWLTTSGTLRFGVYPSGASIPYPSIGTTAKYNDGAWHHAVGSVGPTYGLRLFVDGSLAASNASVTTGTTGSGAWCISYSQVDDWGTSYTPTYQHLAATIDEVAIYPTELAPERIALHYNAAPR